MPFLTTHIIKPSLICATLLASAVGAQANTAAPETAVSVGFVEDTGAADRIRAADRLRTLSQEISAAVCFLHNGQLVSENRAFLEHSIEEFDLLLNALLQGNADLHIIGAETRQKTIRELEAIMAEWAPLHEAAEAILEAPETVEAAHLIYGQSEHLLKTTSHLLSELEGEYAHPTEVLFSDLLLLEFSGRQAMLTQKIAYETCLVWSGYGGQAQIDDLKVVTDQFDLIARALHDGRSDLGIAAAPTDEIRVALEEVVNDWDEVLVHLEPLFQSGQISVEDLQWICKAMAKKMMRMEEVVVLYADYSRRAIQ